MGTVGLSRLKIWQLWRRMVSNILCNNNDDLRNHGFFWDSCGWRLSPRYDIVSSPQVGTECNLAIVAGRNGYRTSVENELGGVVRRQWIHRSEDRPATHLFYCLR
jgi:hypothetical protein